MRVLVTGANGFLGSHLVDHLVEQGSLEIRAQVRKTSNLQYLQCRNIEKVYGDVTQPVEELGSMVANVDVVYHLAGLTKALTRKDFYEVNERGTEKLIQACVQKTTPPRFVFISSADAMGPSRTKAPLDEQQELRPVTVYGRSKRSAEQLVKNYQDRLSVTILRPAGIYGPRDLELLPVFKVAKLGLAIKIGFFEGRYNFGYVKDIVRAIHLAGITQAAHGEDFLLGGQNTSQTEMARIIAQLFGKKWLIPLYLPKSVLWLASIVSSAIGKIQKKPGIFCFGNIGRFLAKNWALDLSKAETLLGYRPEVDLKSGMEESIEWYKEHDFLIN